MDPFTERTPRVVSASKLHRAAARRKSGRFLAEGANSVEAALTTGRAVEVFCEDGAADRSARKPACPFCGEVSSISRWSYDSKCKPGQQVYYAPFRCENHGYFLARITMSQAEDGNWWGRVTVPSLSDETVRQYTHIQRCEELVCKAAPGTKRRRRHRHRKKKD